MPNILFESHHMIVLLNASIIGACAVSLSTSYSYAFGDVFKVNHSLHRKLNEAKPFYRSYARLIMLAGAIVCADPECTARAADLCSADNGGYFASERYGLPGAAHRRHPAGGQDRPVHHRTLRDTVCVSRRHLCYTDAPTSCDTLCAGGGRAEGMSVPVGSDAKK